MSKQIVVTILAVAFVCFLIAIFTFSVVTPPQPPENNYGLWEFILIDGFWHTNWQEGPNLYDIAFKYHPADVDDIKITGYQPSEEFSARKEVYITFALDASPEEMKHLAVASADLNFNLYQVLNKNVINACITNVTGCEGRPVMGCEEGKSVMKVLQADEPAITITTPECVTLQGPGEELGKAVSRLLYAWYGIIE